MTGPRVAALVARVARDRGVIAQHNSLASRGTYDPSTRTAASQASTPIAVKVLLEDYTAHERDATIQVGDRKLILAWQPPALALGTPDTGLSIVSLWGLQQAALPPGSVLAGRWAAWRAIADASGVASLVAAAADYGAGYASEALALAALPAVPAAHTALGQLTAQAAAAFPLIAGTDALFGGASGHPAQAGSFVSAGVEPVPQDSFLVRGNRYQVQSGVLTVWDDGAVGAFVLRVNGGGI